MNDGEIIDIRSKDKYNIEHIPGAKNITSLLLISNPEHYLDKSKKYYIYCQSGNTSKEVVERLNYMGYNTVNIIGGFNYYKITNK